MKIVMTLMILVVVLITVQALMSFRFISRIEALQHQLVAGQSDAVAAVAEIPQIVLAFAQKAGAEVGAPPMVHLTQSVSMRLAPDQPWQSLSATHMAGTRTSGFVWHANGTMMNIVPVGVLDAYVDGEGVLNARLFNAISVASSTGPTTDKGELMRYLAEIPWTPDAILNNADLVWEQIDATTVSVTAMSSDGPVTLEFTFDDAGDIVSAYTKSRPMGVGKAYENHPWGGRFSNYQQIGPRRIPKFGEVEWLLPDGPYIYFRGTIDTYDLQ